jgi:hypothetical protein
MLNHHHNILFKPPICRQSLMSWTILRRVLNFNLSYGVTLRGKGNMDYRTAYVINHFIKPRKPQEYYDRRTAKFVSGMGIMAYSPSFRVYRWFRVYLSDISLYRNTFSSDIGFSSNFLITLWQSGYFSLSNLVRNS